MPQSSENLSEESLENYLQLDDRVEPTPRTGTVIVDIRLAPHISDMNGRQQIALAMLFDDGLMEEINAIAKHVPEQA